MIKLMLMNNHYDLWMIKSLSMILEKIKRIRSSWTDFQTEKRLFKTNNPSITSINSIYKLIDPIWIYKCRCPILSFLQLLKFQNILHFLPIQIDLFT